MSQDSEDEKRIYLIEFFKPRLVKYIEVSPVLDYLASLDKNIKEQLKITKQNNGNQAAAEQLINYLVKGPREPGWFVEFVQALKETKCSRAAQYLSPEPPTPSMEATQDCLEQLIIVLYPELLNKIDPKETAIRCQAKELCSQEDVEAINSAIDQKGETQGNRELLTRIVKKHQWFSEFLNVLRELGNDSAADYLSGTICDENAGEHSETGAFSPQHQPAGQDSETGTSGPQHQPAEELYLGGENKDTPRSRESPVPEIILRDYQMEVAKPALEGKNIIVCLPTGSGKTRVAVYITREHLKKRQNQGLTAKAIVLVNKVPLVEQHYRSEFLPFLKDRFRIIKISGDSQMKISFRKAVQDHDVIICTAQILENSLIQAAEDEEEGVHMSDFSLIVIDECHHTQKDAVYNNIMIRYIKHKSKNLKNRKMVKEQVMLPQILGLTASPGVGGASNLKKAEDHILRICANLDAFKIMTVQENVEQLKKQVKEPNKEVKKADGKENPLADKIKDVMRKIEKYSMLFPQSEHGTQSYEQWVIQTEKKAAKEKKRKEHVCSEHLRKYNDALLISDIIRMTDALTMLSKFYDEEKKRKIILNEDSEEAVPTNIDETDRFLIGLFYEHKEQLRAIAANPNYENENLNMLRESLMEEFTRNNRARGIIFTKTRQSAVALNQWISDNDKFTEVGIRSSYLIGAGHNSDFSPMTQNEQKTIIHKFSTGEFNLLVATSVAEEGLDIKECNFVIRYGLVTNEISMVQARGRARAEDSAYLLVAPNSSAVERNSVNESKEEMMHKAILKVQKMDCAIYFEKIKEFQQQNILEKKMKAKKTMQKTYQLKPSMVKFHCRNCSNYVCSGEDIQVIEGMHHVNTTAKFSALYCKGDNKTLLKKFADYQTNGEIICKGCGKIWGSMMVHKGAEVPCLKVCNFIVKYDDKKMTTETYNKWGELNIRFPAFKYSDLSSDADDD
ncbi:hypothetical protein GDO86_016861 [Hymenochirus boettgeri]|uniref:RNA helicase n=1 Tax=Hymenochirus boettgeri TaxID=247094 RepID=A0A8T2IPC8_9PIPI|nr:hypothetical protein GDO86_016861 [Hymenochirus boettgeri]